MMKMIIMLMSLIFVEQPLLLVVLLVVLVTVFYYYRPRFRGLRDHLVFKTFTKPESAPRRSPAADHNCPQCDGKMERGYLISPHTISWSSRNKGLFPNYLMRSYGFPPARIPGLDHRSQLETSLEAVRCRSCEIILINTRDNPLPETA
ncbi:MAG: PF20097 family protein [Candidatus Hermodarchaeia archaeon]|jgi:hypothetical protein